METLVIQSATEAHLADPAEAARSRSQIDLIHARLALTPGEWVSMMDLHRISGSYVVHSRISEIRKRVKDRGQTVDHITTLPNETHKHFYRLTPLVPSVASAPIS